MNRQYIDGQLLKDMIIMGAHVLEHHKKAIDLLNVFPVPDGDTGTNMSLTMGSAVQELLNSEANTVSDVAEMAARGSLRGARGNSGVILSQLFRGFAKGLSGLTEATPKDFANACRLGVDMAYKAVMKPKEGTILTVSREAAQAAMQSAIHGADWHGVLNALIDEGENTLEKTPDMLAVLKQAGVVDAGAKGLLLIYAGYRMALNGETADEESNQKLWGNTKTTPLNTGRGEDEVSAQIQFAYCTEFVIRHLTDAPQNKQMDSFRRRLERIGDSVLVVGDLGMIKVHVHSNEPGKVLQMALQIGQLSDIKIDNMLEQHGEFASAGFLEDKTPETAKEMGIVAVASGEGIIAVLKDLMVDQIVEGGQTMNPSVEDISRAIEAVNAQKVFILPNNINIILAAKHAAESSSKLVCVLSTTTIPKGISALLAYNPDIDFEANAQQMQAAADRSISGEVTYAVRNTKYVGKEILAGDILGIREGEIKVVGKDVEKVTLELAQKMVTKEHLVITVFYGHDISEQQAQALKNALEQAFTHCDVEMVAGKQPFYYYLVSVE